MYILVSKFKVIRNLSQVQKKKLRNLMREKLWNLLRKSLGDLQTGTSRNIFYVYFTE